MRPFAVLSILCVFAGCQPSGAPGGAVIDASDVLAGSVMVRGSVFDIDTRAPIAGAIVVSDGGRASTSADGGFSLLLPYGSPFLAIEAPGYVQWNQRVPVTPVPMAVRAHLKKVERAQSVGPAGGTVFAGEAGEVAVEFPAGALASEGVVELAYIPPSQIEVLPGRLQWVSQDTHYSIVAAISVVAPPLARTAIVHLPHFGWPAEELVIAAYDPATNSWGERHPAVSSDAASVSFEVPHFSIWAAVRQVRREQGRPKVVRVEGDVTASVLDQPAAVEAGTVIVPEMMIHGAAGASMTVVGSDGSMHAIEGPWQLEERSGVFNLMYGHMRYWTIKLLNLIETPEEKVLRTRNKCTGGVRGTVATVRVASCPGAPSVHHVEYEATESPIEVSCGGTYLGRAEPGETIGAYVDDSGLSDLAACLGCTGGAGCPDAGAPDAGGPDGMPPDAESSDAAMPDASFPDASLADASMPDAGNDAPPVDGPSPDAGGTRSWSLAMETSSLMVGPGGTGAGQVDSAVHGDFSPYPADPVGPIDTFGRFDVSTGDGLLPIAYYARAWSQTSGLEPKGVLHLKTTTFAGTSFATWVSPEPTSADVVYVVAAATLVFESDRGAALATLLVTHRSESGVETTVSYPLRLGEHLRSYAASTEFTYLTDPPTSAQTMYTGPCPLIGPTLPECYLDAARVPLTGAHAAEPIVGIQLRAERVFEQVNGVSIYGGLRVYAITALRRE